MEIRPSSKTWLEPQKIDVPLDLSAAVGGHPLVAEVLVRRGISDPLVARGYLNPDDYSPASPYQLSGMQACGYFVSSTWAIAL